MKILQQQVSKFAEVNEKFVGDCAELNSKIDILKNENDLLKIENAKLKNQIQNNNAYEQILKLLKNHLADFKTFEKKFDDIHNITALELQKLALKEL